MIEDAFRHHCFIICVVLGDNNSTTRAVIKHPSKGAQGQVLKSSKGKVDKKISVPYFLADPSYRLKVVVKKIFSIVNNGKSQQCGCTTADALRLKKYCRYMIKNNINKIL